MVGVFPYNVKYLSMLLLYYAILAKHEDGREDTLEKLEDAFQHT